MIRIKLSAKLGELRWSQADLARATKIRPNTINEMYNCLCERINLEHLNLICEALNCDITDILEYVPNKIKVTVSRNGSGSHSSDK